MEAKTPETPQYATLADLRWIQSQIDRSERKIRMILDMLIAKKIINEAEAKIFNETKTNSEELLKWYLGELEKKQKAK